MKQLNEEKPQASELTLGKLLLKSTVISLGIVSILLLFTFGIVSLFF